MNNPDSNIFKIDRENDIEEFSRYREKGISSIYNINKSNIPSRLGKEKIVAGNYRLSNTSPLIGRGMTFDRLPTKDFLDTHMP